MAMDFPTSPTNGQVYNNFYWDSSTSAWRNLGSKNALSSAVTDLRTASPITVASQAARDALYPTPVQGQSVFRTDLGVTQRYYGLFNSSTNPGGRSTAGWYQEPIGRVLQTVNTTLTTSFASTSGSFVTTGLTATITPSSATSKILAIVHQTADLATGRDVYTTLYRDGSNLAGAGSQMAGVYGSLSSVVGGAGFTFLDSPATTSATTYAVYGKGASAGWSIREWNRAITLLEISA